MRGVIRTCPPPFAEGDSRPARMPVRARRLRRNACDSLWRRPGILRSIYGFRAYRLPSPARHATVSAIAAGAVLWAKYATIPPSESAT